MGTAFFAIIVFIEKYVFFLYNRISRNKKTVRTLLMALNNKGSGSIKILDITYELNEDTKVYQGDPHFIKEEIFTIDKDGFALSVIHMGTHLGTHTDAPSHFIEGGKSLADIPLSSYIGECSVTGMDGLKIPAGTKLLLKSAQNCEARLSSKQATELVQKGVRLVGTDALSIGDDAVHKILLGSDCIILEHLNLEGVAEGSYFLYAFPLKIDADGSPVRACLITGAPQWVD
ncbi:MAG: cyclase family protein [Eubacteriales bacterium]